jgi:hypothetical protein
MFWRAFHILFQAQYERMVMQEDSRLNKLIHVQMQCEPNVSDLAIQTEFVAPPVRNRMFNASDTVSVCVHDVTKLKAKVS